MSNEQRGFTLVELLVVIAIIAALVTALMPAVQAVRTNSRRTHCRSNMLQLIMATQNYEFAHERYPSGVTDPGAGPIRSTPLGYHQSWVIPLLPYLDERAVFKNIDLEQSVYHEKHERVRHLTLGTLACPSEIMLNQPGESNYAACHHDVEAPIDANNNGVFFLNSQIAPSDVEDGLAHTIFFGEKTVEAGELGWISGTRSTLRNTGSPLNSFRNSMPVATPLGPSEEEAGGDGQAVAQPAQSSSGNTELSVGGFSSHHPSGVHFAFGDGRIQFISNIDAKVYRWLGHRNDGQLLDVNEYRD